MRLARTRAPLSYAALTSLILCIFALLPAAGCSFEVDDCELLRTCARCDPSQTSDPIADDCGFFVSRSSGSDDSAGAKGSPVRTLAQAVKLAQERKSHVYACAEVFPESVIVPAGIKIFGGLDCSKGWVYPGGTDKTTIAPEEDGVPITIEGGDGTTRLQNIVVKAADARSPGTSSIAILARQDAKLEISRCDIIAGRGADGEAGEKGGGPAGPAASGVAGSPGIAACIEEGSHGGAPVVSSCAGVESRSGKGGDGDLQVGHDGEHGALASKETGDGMGGAGENESLTCSPGAPGADGLRGLPGSGGRGKGRILAAGYVGEPGQDGSAGFPGKGGGGGGGARSLDGCASPIAKTGASGGSGGSGGCGGVGGLGGGAGGASIGIVSLFAAVSLDAVNVTVGRGGDGGAGGLAQVGGEGGLGGEGGSGEAAGANEGCRGGAGGRGGDGGRGGGGLGGPAIGIAFMGKAPARTAVTFKKGEGGKGGMGEPPQGSGDPGLVGDVVSFEEATAP